MGDPGHGPDGVRQYFLTVVCPERITPHHFAGHTKRCAEKMIDQTNWKRAEKIVRRVIHEMDPYGLLSGGAPDDEFDSEILEIVGAIKTATSETEITEAISSVFGHAFDPETFRPEVCSNAGLQIFNSLREAKII